MPYPMRPNQNPADILPQHQMDWREVAKLNRDLELIYIEPGYADLAARIVGRMGGAHFEVHPQSELSGSPVEMASVASCHHNLGATAPQQERRDQRTTRRDKTAPALSITVDLLPNCTRKLFAGSSTTSCK